MNLYQKIFKDTFHFPWKLKNINLNPMRLRWRTPGKYGLFFLFLFQFSSVQAATDCTLVTQIPQAECETLVALYNSTNGPSWSDSPGNNWNVTNTPCDSWAGITCFSDPDMSYSTIISIERLDSNLVGTLPNLSALTWLATLALSRNQLSGPIPDLSALTRLQSLHLDDNQLCGEISSSLASLSNLTRLELEYNHLTASDPTFIAFLNSINPAWTNQTPCGTPPLENPTSPEIDVRGNGTSIPSGDTTPSLTDDTDFGSVNLGSSPTHQFAIFNSGEGTIKVNNISLSGTGCAPFLVTPPLVSNLGPHESTSFQVTFVSNSEDSFHCTVRIDNDDSNENPYTFDLTGKGYRISADLPSSPVLPSTSSLGISIDGAGEGRVTSQEGLISCTKTSGPCQATYNTGTSVKLMPTAAAGSYFSSWGGHEDCSHVQVQLLGNRFCVAYFQKRPELKVSTAGEGTVTGSGINCGDNCTQNYPLGTQVTLTTLPAPDAQFQGWSGACTGNSPTVTVTMNTAKTCQATFIKSFPPDSLPPVVSPPPNPPKQLDCTATPDDPACPHKPPPQKVDCTATPNDPACPPPPPPTPSPGPPKLDCTATPNDPACLPPNPPKKVNVEEELGKLPPEKLPEKLKELKEVIDHLSEKDIAELSPTAKSVIFFNILMNGGNAEKFAPAGWSINPATSQIEITEEVAKQLPTSVAERMTAQNVAMLSPKVMVHMPPAFIKSLPLAAIKGLTKAQIENLSEEAAKAFTSVQIPLLNLDAVLGFTEPHLSNMPPETKVAFSSAQRMVMHPFLFDPLPPTEPPKIDCEATPDNPVCTPRNTKPVKVTIDEKTGEVKMPTAKIDISNKEGIPEGDIKIEMDIPDLTQPLVIDGKEVPPITEQLAETVPNTQFFQKNGILNMTSIDEDGNRAELAMLPSSVEKAGKDELVGISEDKNGNHVFVTSKELKITCVSAPKDIVLLRRAVGGKVKMKKHGIVILSDKNGTEIAVMFSPFIDLAPKGSKVGMILEGQEGKVVYPGSTMQNIIMVESSHSCCDLTIFKSGTGTGGVTGKMKDDLPLPSDIDCGNKCTATFNSGQTVKLKATPDQGSLFLKWGWQGGGNGCHSSDDTINVTITQNTQCTAIFMHMSSQLTVSKSGTGSGRVTSSPSGIDCGNKCRAKFNLGQTVTLTATPDSNSQFLTWQGGNGCNSSNNPAQVMIIQDTQCIAIFAPYRLTVLKNGTGSGTVTSSPPGINCGNGNGCSAKFNLGQTVTLTATPDPNSRFLGWSGSCHGSNNSVQATITKNTQCTATFARNPHLIVSKNGVGTVTGKRLGPWGTNVINCGNDCDEWLLPNSTVKLQAKPALGYEFKGWSGAHCSSSKSDVISITVTQDTTCTATFSKYSRLITVTDRMYIFDDDGPFSYDEYSGSKSGSIVLTNIGSPKRVMADIVKMGGEVRVELYVDATLLNTHGDVSVSYILKLFEGTSVDTIDLEGMVSGSYQLSPGSDIIMTPYVFPLRVDNEELFDTGYVQINSLVVSNGA